MNMLENDAQVIFFFFWMKDVFEWGWSYCGWRTKDGYVSYESIEDMFLFYDEVKESEAYSSDCTC